MAQYGTPDVAISGMLDGGRWVDESAIAQEDINFGAPVFGMPGEENTAYNFHKEVATVTLSTDLITANVIDFTFDGITSEVTFATDHDTTMAALVDEIEADFADYIVSAVAEDDVLTVTFLPQYDASGVAVTVTLGDTQPTVAIVGTTTRVFMGVAPFIQIGGAGYGAGDSAYQAEAVMDVLTRGRLWVDVASTVTDKAKAYVDSNGLFTNVSTNNYDMGGYFRSNATSNLAILEVNGLK